MTENTNEEIKEGFKPTYDQMMEQAAANKVDEEVVAEFAPASPELLAEIEKALGDIKKRSFSGRNPELGKMVNCPIHGFRHRKNEFKCEQRFKYLHTEEDMETGEVTDITAVLPGKSRNQVVGAARFKGKRHKPHVSFRMLRYIQIVRDLLPDEYEKEDMLAARKKANKIMGLNERKSFGTMLKPEVQGKSVGNLKFSKFRRMGY